MKWKSGPKNTEYAVTREIFLFGKNRRIPHLIIIQLISRMFEKILQKSSLNAGCVRSMHVLNIYSLITKNIKKCFKLKACLNVYIYAKCYNCNIYMIGWPNTKLNMIVTLQLADQLSLSHRFDSILALNIV